MIMVHRKKVAESKGRQWTGKHMGSVPSRDASRRTSSSVDRCKRNVCGERSTINGPKLKQKLRKITGRTARVLIDEQLSGVDTHLRDNCVRCSREYSERSSLSGGVRGLNQSINRVLPGVDPW